VGIPKDTENQTNFRDPTYTWVVLPRLNLTWLTVSIFLRERKDQLHTPQEPAERGKGGPYATEGCLPCEASHAETWMGAAAPRTGSQVSVALLWRGSQSTMIPIVPSEFYLDNPSLLGEQIIPFSRWLLRLHCLIRNGRVAYTSHFTLHESQPSTVGLLPQIADVTPSSPRKSSEYIVR
jgi:hypothetical protein